MAMVLNTNFPELKLFKRGKVRDIYDFGSELLIVATDRISAFDIVLPDGIPNKGIILTKLSCFWFNFTSDIVKNHLITADVSLFPKETAKYRDMLQGRSILVKKTKVIPIECVVRGYLAGSGWKEYTKTNTICGIKLPSGLHESEKLAEPIFTPATKVESGHDENITFQQMQNLIGYELSTKIRDISIKIYQKASSYAETKGIIIADTKMEFGLLNDDILLIDELLTPDSSRFWDAKEYKTGISPPSFDKQYIRDYLENINWNKKPPAPRLPKAVIIKTQEKYQQALDKILG
ncbi:MAG: phosphoribosylaminoimidazolesuccinocarboxamide synthase [candidate division WOR-3 bacterium]|nr:phosphoribosylaminoimidazolesuccinocarboxamide synthase [candidate division WOR-3 bacterium]